MLKIEKSAEKASKSKAYDLIAKLKQGDTLLPIEIDSLLLHFAPAIPAKAKTAEQWCAKACAKNDARKYLQYLHVRDGKMYGCDGHRTHRADTDLPDGYYCPKTLASVEVDRNYPDVDRVMKFFSSDRRHFDVSMMKRSVTSKKLNVIGIPDEVYWNEKYVADATNQAETCQIEYVAGDKMIGKSEFGDFAVMVVRV